MFTLDCWLSQKKTVYVRRQKKHLIIYFFFVAGPGVDCRLLWHSMNCTFENRTIGVTSDVP